MLGTTNRIYVIARNPSIYRGVTKQSLGTVAIIALEIAASASGGLAMTAGATMTAGAKPPLADVRPMEGEPDKFLLGRLEHPLQPRLDHLLQATRYKCL